MTLQTGAGNVIASAACYESNGGQANTCNLLGAPMAATTFYVVIDSKHGSWNWMGNFQLYCGERLPGCTGMNVMVTTPGTTHEASTAHGGHVGTTLNPRMAFYNEMVLWSSPSAVDVVYTITYPTLVTLSGLTTKYDAGATVKLQTSDGTNIVTKDCYDSNGGQANTCRLQGARTTGTSFQVVIDSRHSTWNWMGDIEIMCTNAAVSGCDSLAVAVQSAQPSLHTVSTSHGGHYGSTMDPHAVFFGKMALFASPSALDITYRLDFATPVTLSGLMTKYDAGATVKLQTSDGTNIVTKDCYDSNGGQANTCTLTGSATTGTQFLVVIDSTHSTWNWMGDFQLMCASS